MQPWKSIDWPEQRGFERKKTATTDDDDTIVISRNRFMCAALKLFKIKYKARSLYFIRCAMFTMVFHIELQKKRKKNQSSHIQHAYMCIQMNWEKFSGLISQTVGTISRVRFTSARRDCQSIVNILLENADWWWRRRRWGNV